MLESRLGKIPIETTSPELCTVIYVQKPSFSRSSNSRPRTEYLFLRSLRQKPSTWLESTLSGTSERLWRLQRPADGWIERSLVPQCGHRHEFCSFFSTEMQDFRSFLLDSCRDHTRCSLAISPECSCHISKTLGLWSCKFTHSTVVGCDAASLGVVEDRSCACLGDYVVRLCQWKML